MKQIVTLAAFALAACQTAAETPQQAAETFGAPLSKDADIAPLGAVLAQPDAHQARTVVVEGTVRRVCQAKGCWMELAAGPEEDAPGARITFKDYGFFVPMDCAGATARVEGVLEVTTMSKEHVEHMEAEGATVDEKAADGSAREVRLVASGVELYRKG